MFEKIKAIFSDRDGVITRLVKREDTETGPWHPEEVEYFPKIMDAIQLAHELGYKFFVVTNQPDYLPNMNGTNSRINLFLIKDCNVDAVEMATERGSKDYKPNTGMIERLTKEWNIDLEQSWMIGDTWRDCVCARLAGLRYIHTSDKDPIGPVHGRVDDLSHAIHYIKISKEFEEIDNETN